MFPLFLQGISSVSCDTFRYSATFAAITCMHARVRTSFVRSYEVGPDHRLTVPALLAALHDLGQQHAAVHGYGYETLRLQRRAWALVSMDLVMTAPLPRGEATYTTATAVAGRKGPLVYRDYQLHSGVVEAAQLAASRSVVSGRSAWVFLDLERRRAARLSSALQAVLDRTQQPLQHAITHPARLDWSQLSGEQRDEQSFQQHRVGLHDCDFNGHLNNVVAARWLLDSIARAHPHLLQCTGRRRLQITYSTEGRQDDLLACELAASSVDGLLAAAARLFHPHSNEEVAVLRWSMDAPSGDA